MNLFLRRLDRALGILSEAAGWTADIENKKAMVTREDPKTGEKKQVPITTTYVVLTNGRDSMKFHVFRRDGKVFFSDTRLEQTGKRDASYSPLSGPTQGERYAGKGGDRETLTPRGWADQVERLLGWDQTVNIMARLGAFNQ